MNAQELQPRSELIRVGHWLHTPGTGDFERLVIHLPIPNLPPRLGGFRILHLTDLHLTPRWVAGYDDLHAILRANPPDLLLCTGDFVEHKWMQHRAMPTVKRFINNLVARFGLFGILGNHDGDLLLPNLIGLPIHILNAARTLIETDRGAIELIGLPGVHRWDLDGEFLRSIPPRDPATPRIVMQHYPDQVLRTQNLLPDLVLAGHTHGGQICLPGGIPILRHDSLPRPLTSGVHRFGNTWLIVGRGFGFSSLPIRLFCPPQIIEIVLERAA